ncbi:acetylornithine aminotransferase [Hypnocyclicus thermotrophus]|uniref:Acetylornithine aminotransferase n=1 Tax=Hypnocyclicus thermotrophus TaxID=1627895 RepID=A0AA46E062_9FUSO|nr:acetylornithine/succinylornithine family transaminase [Hypnocyclicus thermotrophus]TDT72365.1 acetylornithine aminotransferase [Hypnocyclicus thermotrophus]
MFYEEDKKYILNTYKRIPIEFAYGDGGYLFTYSDEKYLDFFSGIAVNQLGHNNEGIKNAIKEQLNKYLHLSNYFIQEPVVKLAKLLVENSFASKVFFTNSGAESNEGALKLAVKWGRNININKTSIVSALNGFHGRTTGSLALTGQPEKQKPFQSILPKVNHFIYNDIDSLREIVNENTCCVFLETIQGEGGVVDISEEFLNALIDLKNRYNFLIIVDDIQAGLFRTTELFSYMKYKNFIPDILTTAKAIGGGLPLGAILVSEKLENVFVPGDHGTTFGGNPVACAAGVYLLQTLTNEDFIDKSKSIAKYLYKNLLKLKEKYPIIKGIKGRGYMLGLEVGNFANTIKDMALERKMLLNVTNNTVVRLLPRVNSTKEEIDEFLSKFEDILNKISYLKTIEE